MKKGLDKIRFLEDCLLIDNSILVIGDMHIGYEEHVFEEGLLPRMQLKQILEKFNEIFKRLDEEKIKIKQIVLLGDLKHEFGGISDSEWRETLQLIDYLNGKISSKNKTEKIILIKGNHDNILGPIAKKREIKVRNFYKIRIKVVGNEIRICFLHGNKLFKQCLNSRENSKQCLLNAKQRGGKVFKQPKQPTEVLIMGHLHPSITLRDNYKSERFKCFLFGKWKGNIVYILPSFSPISFGYDVSSLKQSDEKDGFVIVGDKSLKKFEVLVYNNKERKVHNFGRLNKIRKN